MDFLADWIGESLEWLYTCLVLDALVFWWAILADSLRQILLLIFGWLLDFLNSLDMTDWLEDATLIVTDAMTGIPYDVWHFAYKFGYHEMMLSFVVVVPAIILFKFTMQIIRG